MADTLTFFDRLRNLSVALGTMSVFAPPVYRWLKVHLTRLFIQSCLFSVEMREGSQLRDILRYIKLMTEDTAGVTRVLGKDEERGLPLEDQKDNAILESNNDKLDVNVPGHPNFEACFRRDTLETQLFRVLPLSKGEETWLDRVPFLWLFRGQWVYLHQGDSFLVKLVPETLRDVAWRLYETFIHQALMTLNSDKAMELYHYLSNFTSGAKKEFTFYTLYFQRALIALFRKQAAQVNHMLTTKKLRISILGGPTDSGQSSYTVPPRPMSTIIREPNSAGYQLDAVLENFWRKDGSRESEADRATRQGYSYQQICLLKGPPGNGKSSLLQALANKHQVQYYFVDLKSTKPTRSSLMLALEKTLYSRCIVVREFLLLLFFCFFHGLP